MKKFIIKVTKSFIIAGITLSTLSACMNVPSIEKSSPLLGAYLQGSDLLESDFMGADSIEFSLSETLKPSLEFVETLDFSWFEESVQWTTSTANALLDFETPDVSLPTVHLPNLEFPEIKLSKIALPDVSLQDINLLGSAWAMTESTEVREQQSDNNESFLSKKNLVKANMMDTDVSGIDLSGKDLSGADLRGTDLSNANLTGANLSGAQLSHAELTK